MAQRLSSPLATAPARFTRRHQPVRAVLASEVPANVREARQWISAWKARRDQAPSLPSLAPDTPAAGNNGFQPHSPEAPDTQALPSPVIAADGSIAFSKELLDSFTYEDMIRRMHEKVDQWH